MEKRTWEAPKTLAFDLQEALGNCEDGQTAMGAGSDCNTGETPLFSYESCFSGGLPYMNCSVGEAVRN